jgi:dihydrofolate reductase
LAYRQQVAEVAAALAATDKDVEIGGAGLAAAAIELGLVNELRMSAIRSSSVAARGSCRRSARTSRGS